MPRMSVADLRQARYYLKVLGSLNALYEQGEVGALETFDGEWGQIQKGQSWAASERARRPEAAALCREYPVAGPSLLDLRQTPLDRIGWLEAGLEAARNSDEPRVVAALLS